MVFPAEGDEVVGVVGSASLDVVDAEGAGACGVFHLAGVAVSCSCSGSGSLPVCGVEFGSGAGGADVDGAGVDVAGRRKVGEGHAVLFG